MPLESMDVDSVLKTKKCIAIDTNKLIFVIGIRSKGRLNSYQFFYNSYSSSALMFSRAAHFSPLPLPPQPVRAAGGSQPCGFV